MSWLVSREADINAIATVRVTGDALRGNVRGRLLFVALAGAAARVSYPLRTRIKGKWVRLKTPAQFLDQYTVRLSSKTRAAIAHGSYEPLFASSQGVMIGDG